MDKYRKALVELLNASQDVVRRYSQIYMGGTKYHSISINNLAEQCRKTYELLDGQENNGS